ncbi:hypothetical protein BGZ92_000042 [Podila epicladia]|nr:hypothetical protein BGZ92_000042 [Podila epicladia]
MAPTERVIVLCDGTWAGAETETKTNIFLLAEMMGIDWVRYLNSKSGDPVPHQDIARGIRLCYFPGAGIGGTFLEYLFNGATGHDIDKNCLEVYEYIVQHYTPQTTQTTQPEIWMFGFSRGAYTVRCVAGMIYNCGILKRRRNGKSVANNHAKLTDEEKALCKQVYNIYRSNDPEDLPESKRSTDFRERASYDVPTPVKFMGLFDTVGALGIPYLNPGVGLAFNEFRDTKVSTVVEKVYHAICIHERLWGFDPCHVLPAAHRIGQPFEIHERWFPGCHYDIGRHLFRFFRTGGVGADLGEALNTLAEPVMPNLVFADLVLKWMLESIQKYSQNEIIPDIDARINKLVINMEGADIEATGTGDIYSKILDHGPLGSVGGKLVKALKQFEESKSDVGNDVIDALLALQPFGKPLWKIARFNFQVFDTIIRGAHLDILPFADPILNVLNDIFSHDPFSNDAQKILKFLGLMMSSQFLHHEFKIILDVLGQTRDRRILDAKASVVRYDEEMAGNRTIMDAGRLERSQGTYKSHTYENFRVYEQIMLSV